MTVPLDLPLVRGRRIPLPGTIFAGFAVLAPVLPLLIQRVMVVLLAATVLAALAAHLALRRGPPVPRCRALLTAWGAFVGLGWLSALWALEPNLTVSQAGQSLGALVCLGLAWPLVEAMGATERRRIGRALAIGVVLAAVVVALNAASGLALHRLFTHVPAGEPVPAHLMNKGLLTLALLTWPAALALWLENRRRIAALLPLGVAALLVPLDTQTASAAMLAAVAAAGLTAVAGRPTLQVLAAVLAVVVLALPLIVHQMAVAGWDTADWVPQSWRHRVFIWNFIAERVAERPLIGWGLEASVAMPNYGITPPFGFGHAIPMHAHNNFLQVWLELGLAGTVALLAAVLVPVWRMLALPHGARAFAAGAWTVTLAAALPGYGAGQSWWLFTILAQGLLCVVLLRQTRPS